MKYLYYSLYQFYTKIIRVQRHYPPVISTSGVIAALEIFVIFTIVNIFMYEVTGEKLIKYSPLIPTAIFVILYWVNYRYFSERENEIITEVKSYSAKKKLIGHMLTLSLIVFLIWSYLFDGIYELIK